VTTDARPLPNRAVVLAPVAAAAAVTSGYIHFYLYFEGGYRGITPQTVAGLNISRSFILTAVAGLVLGELLVAAVVWPRLTVPAALGGLAFGVGTFAAYLLTRTAGLPGFTESTTSTEAVIALAAEAVLIVSSSLLLANAWRASRRAAALAVGPTG